MRNAPFPAAGCPPLCMQCWAGVQVSGAAIVVALENAPIEMGNTACGRFEAEKKKNIERAYKKTTAEEKNDLMWKLAEWGMEETNDNESTPPSPTPVQLTY